MERNYKCAAMDARVAQVAMMQGARVNIGLMSAKRIMHTGSTLRPRTVPEKAAIAAALREKVWPLIEAGKIRPVMDSSFPLREASKAHERLESSGHIGKVMLVV